MPTYKKRLLTEGILLHDTGTTQDHKAIEAWLNVNGRTNGLLFCGYHFIIKPDGGLVQTRPHDTVGSHAHNSKLNKTTVGVALVGGMKTRAGPDGEPIAYPADTFTDAQKYTLAYLWLDYLPWAYGGKELWLRGATESRPEWEALRYPRRIDPAIADMEALRVSLKDQATLKAWRPTT